MIFYALFAIAASATNYQVTINNYNKSNYNNNKNNNQASALNSSKQSMLILDF